MWAVRDEQPIHPTSIYPAGTERVNQFSIGVFEFTKVYVCGSFFRVCLIRDFVVFIVL